MKRIAKVIGFIALMFVPVGFVVAAILAYEAIMGHPPGGGIAFDDEEFL